MMVIRPHALHPALARMSVPSGSGLRFKVRGVPQRAEPAAELLEPALDTLSEEELLAERMSFFESSYELNAGVEVSESTWAEALDMCPDSGWPPLAPLPLPPRTRSSKR
jgi:hypothetical protein